MNHVDTLAFFRRNLPHWLVAEKAYFVTLRLHGTLPKKVVEEMHAEREQAEINGLDNTEMNTLRRRQFWRIEKLLDGLRWADEGLCEESVGHMVLRNFAWLEKRGWTIYAAVLMSTHTHLLMRNDMGRGKELIDDLDAFKSHTGRQANRLTGKHGRFWARDSFDHWVRTPERFNDFVRYIVNNPVKAGLVNAWHEWPWTVIDETVRLATTGL